MLIAANQHFMEVKTDGVLDESHKHAPPTTHNHELTITSSRKIQRSTTASVTKQVADDPVDATAIDQESEILPSQEPAKSALSAADEARQARIRARAARIRPPSPEGLSLVKEERPAVQKQPLDHREVFGSRTSAAEGLLDNTAGTRYFRNTQTHSDTSETQVQ